MTHKIIPIKNLLQPQSGKPSRSLRGKIPRVSLDEIADKRIKVRTQNRNLTKHFYTILFF